MNTSETFKEFLSNLVISNKEEISGKYKGITKLLILIFGIANLEIDNSPKLEVMVENSYKSLLK